MWVDADACPGPIRDILIRAASRREVRIWFVAHHPIRVPKSPYLRSLTVAQGLDAADDYIAQSARPGDLVITADIPLAARAVAAGADAVNPRGTLYTRETIAAHLAQRNLMTELREQGAVSGGPAPLGRSQIQAFANALDTHITRMLRANRA
ncbi:MAG: YaiI/YqxD family protein [Gammaproteobacteria bacterium]|nr:YaiI/YqxD family protein [Gammaproteobacteria bacterium]